MPEEEGMKPAQKIHVLLFFFFISFFFLLQAQSPERSNHLDLPVPNAGLIDRDKMARRGREGLWGLAGRDNSGKAHTSTLITACTKAPSRLY